MCHLSLGDPSIHSKCLGCPLPSKAGQSNVHRNPHTKHVLILVVTTEKGDSSNGRGFLLIITSHYYWEGESVRLGDFPRRKVTHQCSSNSFCEYGPLFSFKQLLKKVANFISGRAMHMIHMMYAV